VKEEEKDGDMVASLLVFQKSLDYLQSKAFQTCEKFQQAQKESFSSFINQRQNKPAELIALYIDKIMKSGKMSESEMEEQLDGCLRLFRLVQGFHFHSH
jgi:cullin-4